MIVFCVGLKSLLLLSSRDTVIVLLLIHTQSCPLHPTGVLFGPPEKARLSRRRFLEYRKARYVVRPEEEKLS